MSPASPEFNSYSKFTRGEKCIFGHLIITFTAIITIAVVYLVHAGLVRHAAGGGGGDIFRFDRRAAPLPPLPALPSLRLQETDAYRCVGAAYVAARGGGGGDALRMACGAALLAAQWSLAPARCVAARARPDLQHLLPHWSLLYGTGDDEARVAGRNGVGDGVGVGLGVRRGVVHPRYEDGALTSNVGLFEHAAAAAAAPRCALPIETLGHELWETGAPEAVLAARQHRGAVWAAAARPLPAAQCARLARPVVERARAGELCVRAATAPAPAPSPGTPLLGTALFVDARMVAMASWGDNSGKGFPYFLLDIAPFRHWLETTMSLSSL